MLVIVADENESGEITNAYQEVNMSELKQGRIQNFWNGVARLGRTPTEGEHVWKMSKGGTLNFFTNT